MIIVYCLQVVMVFSAFAKPSYSFSIIPTSSLFFVAKNKSVEQRISPFFTNALLRHTGTGTFTSCTFNNHRHQQHIRMHATTQTSVYGGDFAGQSATFSPSNGKVILVPEHLVPSSMVEWGQIPSCLETITSEDPIILEEDNDDLHKTVRQKNFERNSVQIMPEVGCGLDNLDTMKLKEFIRKYEEFHFDKLGLDGVSVGTSFIRKNRLEIVFCFINQGEDHNMERIRVGINLSPNTKIQIKSPIDVIKERKTSSQSSQGKIADGGGLDARTVSSLIGRDNANKPFSEGKGIDYSTLTGDWKVYTMDENSVIKNEVEGRDIQFWNMDKDEQETSIQRLSLPGNVIVKFGGSPLLLETSFILNSDVENSETSSLRRIVVTQTFDGEKISDDFAYNMKYNWEEQL